MEKGDELRRDVVADNPAPERAAGRLEGRERPDESEIIVGDDGEAEVGAAVVEVSGGSSEAGLQTNEGAKGQKGEGRRGCEKVEPTS